ncbi:hypothetical protein EHM92_04110 [bacterium]|nr:MAG: hypothetical protein EHM92_04110 [bacterium]
MKLGTAVSFAGADYNEEYAPTGVVISGQGTDGQRELFVGATNGRSPFVISRVSSSGKILGEYWHFGSIYGLSALTSEGKPSVIAWGTNDLPDTTGHSDHSFAVIVRLDPAKFLGRTESACTRGFGFPASEAEQRYIRLPRSDVEEALNVPAAAMNMRVERDSVLTFAVNFGPGTSEQFSCFYSFTRNLEPLDVKSDDVTETEQRRLVAEGALKSSWARDYFDSLRAHIEFLR